MGAILEPTAAMGPYSTEARGESFYLGTHPEDPRMRPRPDGVALPAGDVPAVLAALDQIRGHLANAPGLDPGPAGDAPRVYRDGDLVVLAGESGGWLHVYGRDRARTSTVEIAYGRVAELRAALEGLEAGSVG